MAFLPDNTNTTAYMSAQFDEQDAPKTERDKIRGYLGMSGIGHPCMRHIWYGFHWVAQKTFPRRVKRLFDRGDWEEHRIIKDFTEMGLSFFIRDKDGIAITITGAVGEKQEQIIGFAGHVKGHIDGRCLGVVEAPKTEHLCEFKTMNDKSFKDTSKRGCEKAHPVYFAQQQRYMHGLKLTRSLFIATNKNDERRYVERIPYHKTFAEDLFKKEQHIILSEEPLQKIGNSTWFECKYCNHHGICHDGDSVAQNCRTCSKSDLEDGGKWTCSYQEKELTLEEQIAGCQMWKRGWSL